jgi:hypothetical protein
MRKIILLLFSAMLTFGLKAQQPDESTKRALERKIKVSGDYLYGEATADTKEEAVAMAKTTLLSEINRNIQATGVDYGMEVIDLMRGKKYRVIAYIKKGSKNAEHVPIVDNHKDSDSLMGEILNAPSMYEIKKMLVENKKIGKTTYGTLDNLTVPEKAYLIVYKTTGEIVAVLDKGTAINRKDLLSGEMKGQEILEQNQVVWFQLF